MSKLNKAIIAVQTNLNVFAEKSKNNQGKYKYFTETDLFNALKPLMEKNGLGYNIGFNTINHFENERRTMISVFGTGTLEIFHSEGESKVIPITYGAQNSDIAKAIGSALTYMTRYWLCKEFGIATEELDPDTAEISNMVEKEKGTPKPVKPQVTYNETSTGVNRDSILKSIKNLSMTTPKYAEYLKELGINKSADFDKYKDNELLNILKGKL